MQYTHLDLVQSILSSLDSDEVNAWDDTVESRQVGEVCRTAYFNILARAQLPENRYIFTLDDTTDPDVPCLMTLPTHVSKVEWIKYNRSLDAFPIFEYVTYLPEEQFLDMMDKVGESTSNFGYQTLFSRLWPYFTNKAPEYYTIVKDSYFIFDSLNTDVDSTLQSSKLIAMCQIIPTYNMVDNFTPDLDEHQMMLWLNEAKALAFLELKQIQHPKAEQEAKRQWSILGKKKHVHDASDFRRLPDYGMSARRAGYTRYPYGSFREH